jgi:hypothetical protein
MNRLSTTTHITIYTGIDEEAVNVPTLIIEARSGRFESYAQGLREAIREVLVKMAIASGQYPISCDLASGQCLVSYEFPRGDVGGINRYLNQLTEILTTMVNYPSTSVVGRSGDGICMRFEIDVLEGYAEIHVPYVQRRFSTSANSDHSCLFQREYGSNLTPILEALVENLKIYRAQRLLNDAVESLLDTDILTPELEGALVRVEKTTMSLVGEYFGAVSDRTEGNR